ncbi:MAG: hypothetical protein IPN90_03645 [Elusimicrobia bacterium]|nr:hypothetical protein [Elusimicrobiota bacterium]
MAVTPSLVQGCHHIANKSRSDFFTDWKAWGNLDDGLTEEFQTMQNRRKQIDVSHLTLGNDTPAEFDALAINQTAPALS